MASGSTTRAHVPYPNASDSAVIAADIQGVAQFIDSNIPTYTQTAGTTTPATHVNGSGEIWWCTNTASTYYGFNYWDGSNWYNITTQTFVIGSTTPATPFAGLLWYDNTNVNGAFKYYNGSAWVSIIPTTTTNGQVLTSGSTGLTWTTPGTTVPSASNSATYGYVLKNVSGTPTWVVSSVSATNVTSGALPSGVTIPATQVTTGALPSGVTVPATQVTTGALPSGVTVPATQVTTGALPSGVTVPATQVTTGALPSGVTIPISQVTGGGTLPSGSYVPAAQITSGTFVSGVLLPVAQLTGTTIPSTVTASSLTSFGASPALTTPSLGVATATSINGTAIPTSATLLTNASTSSSLTSFGASPALTTPAVSSGGATFAGSASGTATLKAAAAAGGTVTIPNVTGTLVTTGDSGTVSNTMLANSSVTVNGSAIALGGSATVTAAAGTLVGTALNSTVTVTPAQIATGVLTKSGSYTATSSDVNNIIVVTATGSIGLPTSGVTAGQQITIVANTTAAVSITGTGIFSTGTTSGTPSLRAQGSVATAIYLGSSSWVVTGDIV